MSSHTSRWFAGLGAALLVAACNETITEPDLAPPASPGAYALTLSSPTLSIVQGGTVTVTVTVARTNFTGPVTLGVDIGNFHGTLPPGVTRTWTPNPVTANSSVLTLIVDAAAVPGVYDLLVYGIEEPTPGGYGFAWLTLTIVPLTATAPSISLLLSSGSAYVWQGNGTGLTATLTRAGGFTDSVDVTVTGAPSGVTAMVYSGQTSGPVTTAYIAIRVDAATVPGVYLLVVHGTGSGVSEATATFTLTTTVPGFALTLSSPTLSIMQGAATPTTTVNLVRNNFTDPVGLYVDIGDYEGSLPPGVTAAFGPNPATGNGSVLTLTVGAAAVPGVYNLYVWGFTMAGDVYAPLLLTVLSP
jgi:hypothetical protein